ncbi:hypothetical protein CO037_01165, partial [Candidatus Pacearchaeota archaeon CG_4_9_14_0_2_um_filter_30_8]
MRIKNKYEFLFWIISSLFFILKIFELKFKFSDGYIYMYMAKSILEGMVPYRDFFFASPPLQIYLISIMKIFTGENLILLKLIPIIVTVGSSFFIFKFMQKKFGNFEGLVASTLYLFSFLILLTTDYMTGIHITTFFILGMIYFIETDKPFIAGIFASLAILTRLYAPFPVLGSLIYFWIYKRKQIFKFILGTLCLLVPISLFFEIISKGEYLNQIFFFRLKLISGIGLSKFSVLKFFIFGDLFLILGSIVYFFFDKEKRKLALPILATVFSIILYIVYSDIYYLYFGLIIGFLAIFTTKIIFEFKDFKNFKKVLTIILILLILINSTIYLFNYSSASNIPFHKEISNFVKENSLDNETISGSFEIAHLVALESQRKLAGDLIDTNPKNVMTNEFKISDVVEKIKGVKFMIVKGYLLSNGELINVDASIPM